MDSRQPLLVARDVHVQYATPKGFIRAVSGFDIEIFEGEIVGLVGGSGAGKSSAAFALMNLARYPGHITKGEVLFDGRNLLTLDDHALKAIRGKDISLIMQNPRSALNPMLTVGVQISKVIRAHNDIDKEGARSRAVDMLRFVGINDAERRYSAYAHELSGGMAQRVLIAMALSCRPRLLIADEPTSGLDVTIQAQILDDLARSVREVQSSALIVTQDLALVANYCDRVVVMHAGEVVEQAIAADFFERPLHPVSHSLLSATQRSTKDRLASKDVLRTEMIEGCQLHTRCSWSDESECTKTHPKLEAINTVHDVRCLRWEHIEQERREAESNG